MLVPLIITLVIALVVIAVIVNVIQQHRQRLEALKRAEYSKLRNTLEDTEDVLMNPANVPISAALSLMLLKRISYTLKAMVELEPSARDLKQRLTDIEQQLKEGNKDAPLPAEGLSLPDNDQQLINLIKGIKKLRNMLRTEHARGNADTQMVLTEDRRLESLQLKINVESQIKRGHQARTNNMLGSARQYYEKALLSLNGVAFQDEYINSRKAEVSQVLEDIATELKAGNLRDRAKKEEKENKDLDELFAPKRKW
ncbi:hypothetical protein [Arsukibacterium sp.]|uniref:hypothetical protein n=1 Tax=Arsukibacterium sp. TaxID=1977258 RepID=UPI002FD948E6